MSSSPGGFYCSVCDIHFSDSLSASSHKASLKHKKRSGELLLEQQKYKKDEDVTVEDVLALVDRKAKDLGLQSWSKLRKSEESSAVSAS